MVETLLIKMLSGFNSSKVKIRHFGRERKMNDCITPATQFIKMYETSRISTTSIAPVTVLKEENTNC